MKTNKTGETDQEPAAGIRTMVFRFGCSNAFTVGQRACARQTALASELAYIYAAKTKDRGIRTDAAQARFEVESATAKSVCLAGSFNDWNPAATEMIPVGEGRWGKEMALPPGTYEYLFVVHGEWAEDPRATESAPNPFARKNSVLRVSEVVVNS